MLRSFSIEEIQQGFLEILVLETKNPINADLETGIENSQKYLWGTVQTILDKNFRTIGQNQRGLFVSQSHCVSKKLVLRKTQNTFQQYSF